MATTPQEVIDTLSNVQFLEKYARWSDDLGHRETWPHTVRRVVDYLDDTTNGLLCETGYYEEIYEAILNHEVMPSMRLLNQAGKAADANNISIYNCAYTPLESPRDIADGLIILGHGTGLGYSVESRYINNWPSVSMRNGHTHLVTVEDSLEGWAEAVYTLLDNALYGHSTEFDLSLIRPAGSPLMTRGGVASGPEPLEKALRLINEIMLKAQGRELKPIEVHDIMCLIAEAIIAGGVRRSAMIALFDEDDEEMLNAKSGKWYEDSLHRSYANNSIVVASWMPQDWWKDYVYKMHESRSGEPGIFSRYAAVKTRPSRREYHSDFGTNPCGEITLRPRQFCNLSVAVGREYDNLATMTRKVELATIIGTIQSAMIDFKGAIHSDYKKNGKEERLLGVDITGIHDSPYLTNLKEEDFAWLQDRVITTNKFWADMLGIEQSAATTCIKPSGNSSVMLNTASGIHPRLYAYYIRRVRMNIHNPIAQMLMDQGVPVSPENGQTWEDASTVVFSFPIKSPEGATLQNGRTALEQLETWLKWKKNWTEHNPSVTITYSEDELDVLANWLFINQEYASGLSFLPKDDLVYNQLPKEEVTEETYNNLLVAFPQVDFSALNKYDVDPALLTSYREFACVSGSCEI